MQLSVAGKTQVYPHQCTFILGSFLFLTPDNWKCDRTFTTLQALPVGSLMSSPVQPCLLTSIPHTACSVGFKLLAAFVLQSLLYAVLRELHEWVHGAHQRPLWSKGGGLPAWRGQLAQHDDSTRARRWLFWEGEQSQVGAWESCRRDYGKQPVRFCMQHNILLLRHSQSLAS